MNLSVGIAASPDARSGVSQKVFAVMEEVAASERPITASELALRLDVPKPTMHRIVRQLDGEGLLMREPASRGYGVGPRLCNFAMTAVQGAMRASPRQAILERLSAATRETCNFGMISGGAVVYAGRVEAAWPFGLRFEIGSRVPIHCTSMGKLLLAHQPKRRREHLLSAAPLHAYTGNTITDPARLEEEFAAIRARGHAIDDQEFLAGVICLAVPLHDRRGNVCAAVAVSAPQVRMPIALAVEQVPAMRRAAEELEATWADDPSDGGGEE